MGIMRFLISQNVDNLHLKSGIKSELLAELHGNYTLMKCLDCDSRFSRNEIGWNREVHGRGSRSEAETLDQPVCKTCQGRIISSVVNFNEPMPDKEVLISKEHSSKCDLMLIVGSSLSVFPAANLPKLAKQNGAKLIILNIDPSGLDSIADIKLKVKAGEFLPLVVKEIKQTIVASE
jgi:NAD-dependent deacetylase